jgi:protocatechuate 3,4-dioxygenase beta subunit
MFSTDGETVDYYGRICTVEEGRIWFQFLYPTRFEAPTEPPTRGFKYFDWGDWPW